MGLTRGTAIGINGAIATPHHRASTIGLRVLEDGGNALDACVAACAALGVLRPDECGIGGDLFLLLWAARQRRLLALNASGRAGASATPDLVRAAGHERVPPKGPLSVVVPGCVGGWATALQRFGTRDLAELLQPAIGLAEGGFPASPRYAEWVREESVTFNEAARQVFSPGGSAPRPGDVLRNPDYAAALKLIARDGPQALYGGPLGEAIGRFLSENGGHLTPDDIAAHSCQWVELARVPFGEFTVAAMPPNSQALLHLMALRVLEPFDLGPPGGARSIHFQVEAMRLAHQDRWRIADPTFAEVPTDWLLSRERAEQARAGFSLERAGTLRRRVKPGDTVSLCAADREGNVVSMIQSVARRHFGSGLVVPGTGIVLNDRAWDFGLGDGDPNQIAPGKRPRHTLCPGMILRDGVPVFAYGAAGGDVQPFTMLQLTCNLLAFGMDPQDALDRPRWSIDPPETGPAGGVLALEGRFAPLVRQQLQAMGYTLSMLPDFDDVCGRASILQVDRDRGVFLAGADPRAEGIALAY